METFFIILFLSLAGPLDLASFTSNVKVFKSSIASRLLLNFDQNLSCPDIIAVKEKKFNLNLVQKICVYKKFKKL